MRTTKFTTKLLRHRAAAEAIHARYALFRELDIELAEPDWATLPQLAIQCALSGYDAAYLQLALRERVPLVTLDARLAAAYDNIAG